MSLAIDPVTDYQRSVGRDISTHRALGLAFPQRTSYMLKVIDLVQQHKQDFKRNTKFKGEGYGEIYNQLNNLSLRAGFGAIIPSIPFAGGTSLGVGHPYDIERRAQLTAEGLAQVAAAGARFLPETIAWVEDRYNQALEERGYLKFKFFNAAESNFVIPFFENPQIQETRQAKYAVNEVMNRNEPYRLFTGAQPRQVRISFKMTLPHIMTFSMVHRVRKAEEMAQYDSFWGGVKGAYDPDMNFPVRDRTPVYKYEEEFLKRWKEAVASLDEFSEGRVLLPNEPYKASQGVLRGDIEPKAQELLEYVQHMVDTIRSSVIAASNAEQGSLPGPPLAYLKFGTLFDEDQFTVESYDLKFDGKNGYDNVTLLPRVIDVSLNLKSFGSNNPRGRGTALGWDSAFVRLDS